MTMWQPNTMLPAQCTVVKNSDNVTIAKSVEIHHHKRPDEAYKRQVTTILKHVSKRHEDLHVNTRALQEAKDILEDRYWVVVAGNPGDGKTWMGHQLLLYHMAKGYDPLIITCTDDWKKMVEGNEAEKQIVFIDDIFGSVNLDDRKVGDWMSMLENTEALVKERKGELLVVCTTRKIIWTEVHSKVKKYKGFEAMRLLDLSFSGLDKQEKLQLISRYKDYYVIDINSSFVDFEKQHSHGFPHCVELYCTIPHLRKQGEYRFFFNPIDLLEKDIVNLYDSDPNNFFVLLILLISKVSEMRVSFYDSQEDLRPLIEKASHCSLLDQIPPIHTFRKSMEQLIDIYIEKDKNGHVQFKHPSFAEIISLLVARKDPTFALDILDLEFLVNRTKCYKDKSCLTEDAVILPMKCSEHLAKRLTRDILMGNLYALNHEAFTNSWFANVWLKYMSNTMHEDNLSILEHLLTVKYRIYFIAAWYPEYCQYLLYLLECVPISALETLCSALIGSEILKRYWKTNAGNEHLSIALVLASSGDCSTDVLKALLDAGANIDFVMDKHRVLMDVYPNALCGAVATKNAANINLLLSRCACPFISPSVLIEKLNILYLAYQSEDCKLVQLIKDYMIKHETCLPNVSKGKKCVLQCLYGEKYHNLMHKVATDDVHIPLTLTELDVAIKGEIKPSVFESKTHNEKRHVSDTDNLQVYTKWLDVLIKRPQLLISHFPRLLENGFDMNSKCPKTGRTILYALVRESIERRGPDDSLFCYIKKVLGAGADANIADMDGNIPLFDALKCSSDSRLIRLLLTRTNVSVLKNKDGYYAFHFLLQAKASEVKYELIEELIKAGSDINQAENHGLTPLMVSCMQHATDELCIKMLLKNGARIQDTDKRGFSAMHYCIARNIDLKVFQGRKLIISDDILQFAILNIRTVKTLIDIVKLGHIEIIHILRILDSSICQNRYIDTGDIIVGVLKALGDASEIVNKFEIARRLILKSDYCLTKYLQEGLNIHVLVDKGIPLSWLPKEDEKASVIIEALMTHGVDIDSAFTNVEKGEGIEIYLARHDYLKTLIILLERRKSKFDLPDEQCVKDVFHTIVSSSSPETLVIQVCEMLLHSERNKKCLLEVAPSVLYWCFSKIPFKIECAQFLFPRVKHVLFTCDEYSLLLHAAIDALNLYICSSNVNNISDIFFRRDTMSILDNHLLKLLHFLEENKLPSNNQNSKGMTPLMAILLIPDANSLQKSINELTRQAKGFPECDFERRNILHYLTMAKLNAHYRILLILLVLEKGVSIIPDLLGRRAIDYLPTSPPEELKSFCEILKSDENRKMCIGKLVHTINLTEDSDIARNTLIQAIKMISSDVNDIFDLTGVTLLAQATRAVNVTLVTYLLGEEADTNAPDSIGQTALHKLFSSERLLSLSWLIKVCFTYNSLPTTLHMETALLTLARVPVCLTYLRVINTTDEIDRLALNHMILKKVNDALHVLFLLLEAGADPNQMDITGRSPLHHCVGAYIPDAFVCPAIKMLLAYGADVNMEAFDGVTPVMICAQFVHTKYRRMNILIAAGANVAATDYLQNGLPYYSKLAVKTRVALQYMDNRE